MATFDEWQVWLKLSGSLLSTIGFAVLVVSLVYLARQGWKTRGDWRFGSPWSVLAKYLNKFHQEYGHLYHLEYGQQVTFYPLNASYHPLIWNDRSETLGVESLVSLAIQERKSLLITGAAKSGKTTFLQALAIRASLPGLYLHLGFTKPRIPFYLPLEHINPTLPFLPAVSLGLAKMGRPMGLNGLRRAIRSGRALFLFDGLEEIPSGRQRQQMCHWLEEGHQLVKKSLPFIIACRAEALLSGVQFQFPHLTVALRNQALLKFRTLRAVTETRMPAVFRNPVEQNAEYILISPPSSPGVLRGAKKPVPLYYFHMAKYPVTNRLYRAFVEANRHRAPRFWSEKEFSGDDLPVVGIDWEDAEIYCAWLNRLNEEASHANDVLAGFLFRPPSEEEWEWAAGSGERLYPWGNQPPEPHHANYASELARLSAVSAHAAGATPNGVMDMAGNVWEWTSSSERQKIERRVVRGGAAYNEPTTLLCTARDSHAKQPTPFIGFRVARVPRKTEIF